MKGFGYSFDGVFEEMVGDRLRSLDTSVDPLEFDLKEEGIIFDENLRVFRLEEDEKRGFENTHAGKTSNKRLEGRKIALRKKNRDLELLPLEIDYLTDELLEFRIALMNLLHQQDKSQTEIEGLSKGVISPLVKGLINVNQKFVEVTLRNQISDTVFRKNDSQRLKKEIESSKESSKIVDWMMTGKRWREDITNSPFNMMSSYEGSLYYSSLTEK